MKKFKQKKALPQQPDPVGREKKLFGIKDLPAGTSENRKNRSRRKLRATGDEIRPKHPDFRSGNDGSGRQRHRRPRPPGNLFCRSETASTSAETGGIRSEIAGRQGGSSSGVGGLEEEKWGGWTAARGVRMDKVSGSTVKAQFLFFYTTYEVTFQQKILVQNAHKNV